MDPGGVLAGAMQTIRTEEDDTTIRGGNQFLPHIGVGVDLRNTSPDDDLDTLSQKERAERDVYKTMQMINPGTHITLVDQKTEG